jgi:hypothetical protein
MITLLEFGCKNKVLGFLRFIKLPILQRFVALVLLTVKAIGNFTEQHSL